MNPAIDEKEKTFCRIMRPHRLARSRTPDFHSGDRGSNPLGDAMINSG